MGEGKEAEGAARREGKEADDDGGYDDDFADEYAGDQYEEENDDGSDAGGDANGCDGEGDEGEGETDGFVADALEQVAFDGQLVPRPSVGPDGEDGDQADQSEEQSYCEDGDALVESKNSEKKDALPSELTDPKVMEFLRILDEYRLKCEQEGNYEEAERATKQLDNLRNQEMKRQVKALKARQISERQDIQIAHNLQFAEFNASWDKYMTEYDDMAQQYIQQMTDRHAQELRDYQEKMHSKMVERPPKFSRELLEWRRRQHMLARQKNYAEAQKIKKIADMMEAKERNRIDTDWHSSFASKENKFRARQQSELNALLKRIEVRRKEHLAQRNLDSKRLLQRNRNVQAVLTSKQSVEERFARNEIKNRLTRPRNGVFGSAPAPAQSTALVTATPTKVRAPVKSPKSPMSSTFLTG